MRTQTMKLLWSIILIVNISACWNKPLPEFLQEVDAIVNSSPDSAMTLLEQQKENIRFEPEYARMYYHLLTIKVKDKAYIDHTSDSLILQIVRYYEYQDDSRHLPEAYYYAGRVYRDLGDAPQALDYFQKAAEMSKGNDNHELSCRIHNQMGMLYLYQHIYDKALVAFKYAMQQAQLSKDSTLKVYNLRDIGRVFTGLHNIDSTLYYYREAERTAIAIKNTYFAEILSQEISSLYLQMGDYQKAHDAILISSNTIKTYPQPYYATLAELYRETNIIDSASFYYNQLLIAGNHYHKRGAYKGLCQIARQQGNLAKAFVYMDSFLVYSDSIRNTIDAKVVREVNALYNYQFREKENHRLKDIAQQQTIWIVVLVINCCFILIIAFAIYFMYRKLKEQKRLQAERLQEKLNIIAEEQYRNSQQYIIENGRRIEALRTELQDVENQKIELKKNLFEAKRGLLETEKELLELTNRQIQTKQRLQAFSEMAFKEMQIYKDFCHIAGIPGFEYSSEKKSITNEDWKELTIGINKTYNNFTERLQLLYPNISEHELRTCILLKLSVLPRNIAILTARSKQAISSTRKKLYEKTHNKEGSPDKWDDFIKSF